MKCCGCLPDFGWLVAENEYSRKEKKGDVSIIPGVVRVRGDEKKLLVVRVTGDTATELGDILGRVATMVLCGDSKVDGAVHETGEYRFEVKPVTEPCRCGFGDLGR